MTKKVAIYIRTSTDKQENSPEIQRKGLQNYCDIQGYQIFNEYQDYGYSAKTTKRPAFEKMMLDADNKKFDMVLVTKIDRFARSSLDLLINVEKLKNLKIDFAATEQPIDTSSAMGRMTLQMMAAFAEFERAMIEERMTAGRKAAEERGVLCTRPRKKIPIKELLKYITENKLSANSVAKIYNVHPSTIIKRLTENGYIFEDSTWILKEHSTKDDENE